MAPKPFLAAHAEPASYRDMTMSHMHELLRLSQSCAACQSTFTCSITAECTAGSSADDIDVVCHTEGALNRYYLLT